MMGEYSPYKITLWNRYDMDSFASDHLYWRLHKLAGCHDSYSAMVEGFCWTVFALGLTK